MSTANSNWYVWTGKELRSGTPADKRAVVTTGAETWQGEGKWHMVRDGWPGQAVYVLDGQKYDHRRVQLVRATP